MKPVYHTKYVGIAPYNDNACKDNERTYDILEYDTYLMYMHFTTRAGFNFDLS